MNDNKILLIDACVRDDSRTKRIADALLEKLEGTLEEVRLENIDFAVTDQDYLNRRDFLISKGAYDDEMFSLARQFAEADVIVIAAPYWDLSFPASLKQYIEKINVSGLTFKYTPDGYPVGLCKARKLYYVMSVGGSFVPEEFGYGYIKTLAQSFYGIEETKLIAAYGLDIDGADPEAIVNECIKNITI
jgi:FMN-dependent NADH-azoreductase